MKEVTKKLLPCGCGGKAICYEVRFWGPSYTVECEICGIETKPYNTPDEAISVWNQAMGPRKRQKRGKKNEDVG